MQRKMVSRICRRAAFWLIGACLLFGSPDRVAAEDTRALDGIYIEDISVGGMSGTEIQNQVEAKLETLRASVINLYVGEETAQVTAGELGLTWANPEIVSWALQVGQQGNVLSRFKVQKYLEETGAMTLNLRFSVDEQAVRQAVENYAVPLNSEAVDATLIRESGEFTVVGGKDGYTVDVEASVPKLMDYMQNGWRGGIGGMDMVTVVDPARGDAGQLSLVQDVLGSGSTDYSGSNRGRRQNVETGVAKIDGTVLYPGDEFSVTDAVVPFNEENGYALAASYEMGNVVDTYGGGICQVSTTLYLAVLRSELEVTERSSHSMIVGYVKPSMDAAIAEDVKDFRFVNNTDAPIYIMGYADGESVGFRIYGKETRPEDRTVTYESKTISTTECEVKIQADASAAFGNVEQTSSGHEGSEAELWKIVEVNGEETREKINSSYYNMSPKTYTVGIKTENEEALLAMQEAIASRDISKVYAVAEQYPNG